MRFRATPGAWYRSSRRVGKNALPERARHERYPMPLVSGAKSTVFQTGKGHQTPNGCPAHLETVRGPDAGQQPDRPQAARMCLTPRQGIEHEQGRRARDKTETDPACQHGSGDRQLAGPGLCAVSTDRGLATALDRGRHGPAAQPYSRVRESPAGRHFRLCHRPIGDQRQSPQHHLRPCCAFYGRWRGAGRNSQSGQ
ncbi:hypothetical protein D3C73_1220470 [compost metagenome]